MVPVELCNVLHRQMLSQDAASRQEQILSVVGLVVRAASEALARSKKTKLKEIFPANQAITTLPPEVAGLGEGGEVGLVRPGQSVCFALLEVRMSDLSNYGFSRYALGNNLALVRSVCASWSDTSLTSHPGQLKAVQCWPCRPGKQ